MPTVERTFPIAWSSKQRFKAKRFDVTSSLQQPADQWSAEVTGSASFRLAKKADRVALAMGFKDDSGQDVTVGRIMGGTVDEYVLTILPDSVECAIRGRDAMALLIENEYQMLYLRGDQTSGATKPTIDGATTVPTKVGTFYASQVAGEVCASVGLALAWECRDYELWDDFDATGRCVDILQRLIAPWCEVEPSRVDLFVDQDRVILRQRRAFPSPADYTYDVRDARLKHVVFRRRRLPKWGTLAMAGRTQLPTAPLANTNVADPQPSTSNLFGSAIIVVNLDPETGQTVTAQPGQVLFERYAAYGLDGRVIAAVVTTTVKRAYDLAVLSITKDTYGQGENGLVQSGQEKTVNTWEEVIVDAKGAVNEPLPKFAEKSVFAFSEEVIDTQDSQGNTSAVTISIFKQLRSETVAYSYSRDRYLKLQVTKVHDLEGGEVLPSSMIVVTWKVIGPQFSRRTTDTYGWDNERKGWALQTRAADDLGGHPPGGPNRPSSKAMESSDKSHLPTPILIGPTGTTVLSAAANAKSKSIPTNPHMSQADLDFIKGQHVEASDLWEVEVTFDALMMPWLKRGALITFTGIVDDEGQAITVGTALVYLMKASYDEASDEPSMVSSVRAVWWEIPPDRET